MARIIGIHHRRKRTMEGEERPTTVAILDGEKETLLNLKNDQAELDFVREGLQPDDTVAMLFGGSGDKLAFALSHAGEKINAQVLRISAHVFKNLHPGEDDYATGLARLVREQPELFYPVTPRDRDLIMLRWLLDARLEAMKARIGCAQRLSQSTIGRIFCDPEGLYPEGSLEIALKEQLASNQILKALDKEETSREHELTSFVERLEVYRRLFKPITGCGPMIAARLIVAIGDIRRFPKETSLKAFCGVHLQEGKFPRRRSNSVANWNPEARQALFLLADQFELHPDSEWGQRLREIKTKFKAKHPEVVKENGKTKYSPMHLRKMAKWRVRTKFAEWLYHEWWRIECEVQQITAIPSLT